MCSEELTVLLKLEGVEGFEDLIKIKVNFKDMTKK